MKYWWILKAKKVIDFLFFFYILLFVQQTSQQLGYVAAITLRAAAAECDADLTCMLIVSFVH